MKAANSTSENVKWIHNSLNSSFRKPFTYNIILDITNVLLSFLTWINSHNIVYLSSLQVIFNSYWRSKYRINILLLNIFHSGGILFSQSNTCSIKNCYSRSCPHHRFILQIQSSPNAHEKVIDVFASQNPFLLGWINLSLNNSQWLFRLTLLLYKYFYSVFY